MVWSTTTAIGEFLAEAGEFLRAEPARNTVILTVTENLRVQAVADPPAAPSAPSAPAVPAVPAAPISSGAGRTLLGWWRPDAGAGPIGTGADAQVHRRSRLFRLGELIPPDPGPGGSARLAAAPADRDLMITWFDAFAREVGDLAAQDQAAAVDERLSYGGITVWEADGVPVSIAALTRTAARMARVGPVYTPPELRGRGYASAATAAVSQAARDAGAREVVLYTDLANATSNALDRRLGYRPVVDRIILSC